MEFTIKFLYYSHSKKYISYKYANTWRGNWDDVLLCQMWSYLEDYILKTGRDFKFQCNIPLRDSMFERK